MTLTVRGGSGLYKAGERGEYFSYLAGVFESVLGPRSFGLISHDVGEPQGAKNIADARDASARGFGDLACVHLFAFSQQADDREGDRIPQETAQPRLPIIRLIHGRDYYHVFAIAKT
jgi:hypothetical protein